MDAQVIHLDIFNCESNNKSLLVSQPLNQSAEGPSDNPVPPNSFHTFRVPEHLKTSAKGFNCYTFRVRFERKVQIWFLLVDIWIESNDTNIGLDLTPFVNQLRTCVKYQTIRNSVGSDTVLGFYFVCHLNNVLDIKKEEMNLLDTITFDVKTNSTEEVGLEAVFIGDIFKKTVAKIERPDCGKIETESLYVDIQEEINHIYISCNDSFIDLNQKGFTKKAINGNPK